jgi:ferredoxin-type protein NapG
MFHESRKLCTQESPSTPMSDAPNDRPKPPPPPRRLFFAAGLKALFDSVDQASNAARHFLPGVKARFATPAARERPVLRPPGALPEATFLETCERSGRCVAACPVQAIQLLRSAEPRLDGTPYLVPSQKACVVCDDLSCMKACPTGALSFVPKEQIAIGLAVVDQHHCRRSFGEPCRECVDRCPLAASAIGLDARGRVEVRSGCVGCGVCEYYCPTSPRSITVEARR